MCRIERNMWSGCSYCNDPHPARDCVLPDGTEQILVEFGDEPLPECCIYERSIEFCPYCGKPITESAWEKFENLINS